MSPQDPELGRREGEGKVQTIGERKYRGRDEGRLQHRVKVGLETGPRVCEMSALCPILIVCLCVRVCCINIFMTNMY